jgi:MFS family permease
MRARHSPRSPLPSRLGPAIVIVCIVGLARADGAAVGVVAPALRHQLHFTVAEIGLLASLASVTGALSALPLGGLVDRGHRTTTVAIALAAWSLALGAAGLASGFAFFAVARLVSGGIAAIARPAAVSLAGDTYHPSKRGYALAALDAGQEAGIAVAYLLGALAVAILDWRWLFGWLAIGGLALAVIAARVSEPVPERPPGPSLWGVFWALLRIRTNLVVLISDSLGNFFFSGVTSFAVLFFTERFALSTSLVDALAPGLLVGVIVGVLTGGRLGDKLTRLAGGEAQGGGRRRLQVASACQLVAVVVFAVGLLSRSIFVAGTLLFLGALVLGGSYPCLDAVRVDIVPASMWGRAEAARGLLVLASGALGPATFGLVAEHIAHQAHGLGLRDAFLVMLCPLAVGALVLLTAVRQYPTDARAARLHPGGIRP